MAEFNPDVRHRIDAHLDAVEQHLAALPRVQRRAVVDDLDAQITEMLGGPAAMATATVAQVDAVLGRLDAPGTYGTVPPPVAVAAPVRSEPLPVVGRRLCPGAVRGAVWLGLGTLAAFAFVGSTFGYVARVGPPPPPPPPWLATGVPAVLLLFAAAGLGGGTLEGWVALGRLRRSMGRLDGLPLVVFNAVAVPVLLTWLFSRVLWLFIMHGGRAMTEHDWQTEHVLTILTASALTFFLVRFAVRYGRPASAGEAAGSTGAVAAV